MAESLVDIVGEAIQKPRAEREAFIRTACIDEPSRQEALGLLAALDRAGRFMETPTMGMRAPGGTTERPGAVIGRYRLLEQIGEGGFGAVFSAEQTEPVRRTVALKVIKLGMDTRAVVARFEAERQALAMMDHPGIAKVLDAGATETGRPYFVMELVRGEAITRYCESRGLPPRRRLDLFIQVCLAVQHAHTKGIIHRDLKPANVLVTEVDGKPVPRIIDFGIAKATAADPGAAFTEARQFVGTPEYMSPEQAHGAGADLDTRTDVYSLGVLLYELLTGATPLDGTRLRSAAWDQMLRMIREEEPPRPSTRRSAPTDARPASVAALRGDLDWIVMRCLEKDRARRYQTAEALAADIQRHLSGSAVLAAPPSRVYRVRKFVRRHGIGVAAVGAVVGSLILGTVGTTVGLIRARGAEVEQGRLLGLSITREGEARGAAARADAASKNALAVNRLLTSMLARADRTRPGGNPDLTVREAMDLAIKELDAQPGRYEPDVESAVRLTIGSTYRALSLFKPAEVQYRAALALRETAHGADSLEAAEVLAELGVLQMRTLAGDAAARTMLRVLQIQSAVLSENDPAMINTRTGLANAYIVAGEFDKAEPIVRENIRVLSAGSDGARLANALGVLGTLMGQTRRHQEAAEAFSQALEVMNRLPAPSPEHLIAVSNNLAAAYTELGEHAEAIRLYAQVLPRQREFYQSDNPQIAMCLLNYATALKAVGRSEEALAMYAESAQMGTRLWGPRSPVARDPVRFRGMLLETLDRDAEAVAILEPLAPVDREDATLPARHWVGELIALGSAMTRLNRAEEAVPLLREAVDAAPLESESIPAARCHEARGALAEALLVVAAARPPSPELVQEAADLLEAIPPAATLLIPETEADHAFLSRLEAAARRRHDQLRRLRGGAPEALETARSR